MSDKFSARNSCSVSPLRTNSNNFIARGANANKTTSKRNGAKKIGEKLSEDKKNEGKINRDQGCREEFGSNGLNLTLVGSPAPRSQVRALVSSSNLAAKAKAKPSYGSKLRDQNPHEICMEKLYQFADNPTKFVRLENREETELKLDLEFSDRSEESDNFYNSHNIAFGENGEYRIPEYDHIRFLQFSIGDNHDPRVVEGQENTSASVRFDRSTATGMESIDTPISSEPFYDRFANGNPISTIPDGPETQRSRDSPEAPEIDEIYPWNSKIHSSNWSRNLDPAQSHPLGSAINYKNNINPEVEKFMLLDTESRESAEENCTGATRNNRLIDESILSKNFTQAVRLQPFEESVENSSRTSPVTSRTTLSRASSVDGTWHGHSLNSPYFASVESSSLTHDSKRAGRDSSKVISGYDETDEYLTIVKDEGDSASNGSSEKAGVRRYIFITDQFLGSGLKRNCTPDKGDDRFRDSSSTRSTETETDGYSSKKTDRLPDIEKIEKSDQRDISSGETSSDYCIGNIFPRSDCSYTTSPPPPSSSSSSPSNSSASNENMQPTEIDQASSTPVPLLSDKSEENNVGTTKCTPPATENSNLINNGSDPEFLYMTLEEVNQAVDYTSKLSQIFNSVLRRSELENQARDSKEMNVESSVSRDSIHLRILRN